MTKKLLHKTQQIYLIFSILLFVIVAPLFYYFSNKLYIAEVDETLKLHKIEFLQNSLVKLKIKNIPVWNTYNTTINIRKSDGLKNDSIFFTTYFNPIEKEDEPYRELLSPIIIEGNPYTLSIKSNLLELEDFIISIVVLFAIIVVLLLIGLLLINRKLSINLWKPFYNTLQEIEDFEIDKHSKPNLTNSDIEEFNRLNKSIDRLIEKNIIIYNNQREFVENAAHELQTPIAIFKAKVDTLIQRSDVTKGQSEILTSLNDAISRLNRLNKNLLLLSKIEKHYFDESETFSIKELIEKQLDFFIEQAKQKSIEIKTTFQNDFSLKSNKGLTEIMLNNLLLNSIRHNVQNGEVTIYLSKDKLIILNTGKEKELSSDKLFRRFSKSRLSAQGNGLGLAIVKKIADIYNWQVLYSFSENKHSFIVKFY